MNVAVRKLERQDEGYRVSVGEMFPAFFQFAQKDMLCHALTVGAFVAPLTGTSDDHAGDERCIDVLVVKRGGLQTFKSTGGKRDNKWSLTNEKYFEDSGRDAAAICGYERGADSRC